MIRLAGKRCGAKATGAVARRWSLFSIEAKKCAWILPLSFVLLMIAPPILIRFDRPMGALAIATFFSFVCHQDPARSFVLFGSVLPVCVRCFGIYCGAALGSLARLAPRTARRLFLAAVAINASDVLSEVTGLHGNAPVGRLLAGLILGMALSILIFSLVHQGGSAPKNLSVHEVAGSSPVYL